LAISKEIHEFKIFIPNRGLAELCDINIDGWEKREFFCVWGFEHLKKYGNERMLYLIENVYNDQKSMNYDKLITLDRFRSILEQN